MWDEVALAKKEGRRELVLSGKEIQSKVENGGLDPSIFTLTPLNFLEVRNAGLKSVPDTLGELSNLTSLVLKGNELSSLPCSLSQLNKLKLIDLSLNSLSSLPDISSLTELETINLSFNAFEGPLEEFGLGKCSRLTVLELTGNKITSLGELQNCKLEHLMEVVVNKNDLQSVSSNVAQNWPLLKKLDLSENSLQTVPGELGDFTKLKEISLINNPLKDNRLKKMAAQKGAKSVLEYIKNSCPREGGSSTGGKKGGGKKGKKGSKNKDVDENEVEDMCDTLSVMGLDDKFPEVAVSDSVKEIRPYIVICFVTDLDLSGDNLKKFISLQTSLHKTVCENRTLATIATHDLDKVVTDDSNSLIYTAKNPVDLKIVPLSLPVEVQADKLVSGLKSEAEALRKEKKRSQVTGLHQYLHILESWSAYPCLLDSVGERVISFPPVTNSGDTKISQETRSVMIEVTSSTKLGDCKKVMDCLLTEMVGSLSEKITVVQGKVKGEEGELRVTYPSKTDLNIEKTNFKVMRE